MSAEQQAWLKARPEYSVVRRRLPVTITAWLGQGWLFESGRFVEDDGTALFVNTGKALRVGRHFAIC